MRVLTFGWEFPPYNSGGLGVACKGLVTALSGRGLDVLFVLPKKIPTNEEPFQILFATEGSLTRKEVQSELYPYIGSAHVSEKTKKSKRSAVIKGSLIDKVKQYGEAAKDIAREEDFDLIHAHDWLSFWAGIKAKEVSGKPLVVHVHATEFDRTAGQGVNEAVFEIEQQGMMGADKVITVSNYTKKIANREYNIPAEKIDVVHNGVDLSEAKELPPVLEEIKSKGNSIVLFLGRKTIQKGPDYFLKAAKRILETRDDIYFVMAGSGDMENMLIEEAARAGMASHFIFTDFLRGDDVHRVYQSADVYVMPSVSEPFGITPLEAVMNGTPVVISKQSGVSEVLTHALAVDFWDIEEMANKIVAAVDYDALNGALVENGQKQLEHISWDRAAEKCISTYQTIV